MIRVLHIIKSLGRGGAEMLLPETLKLHDKNKFEFHYIYFLPWKDQMVPALEEAGGKVTCFDANNNIAMLRRAGEVKNYIRIHKIDIVHCHLPWSGFLGRYIKMFGKIPVIYTEHNKQERYHGITKFINRISFNKQTLAIAVSQDVADSIHKNIGPVVPVKVISNGVNTNDFVRNENAGATIRFQYKIPADAIVIGTIAVFRFQKRLKEWLEVFKKISDANPSVYAMVVGEGPFRKEIEDTIAQLNLQDKVILPGLQSEVRSWLSAMDIFMMSSVFEGLPIAMLEAMSMGCAVVSTDAGGIKEVIRDKEDGFLVPVDQWQRLEEPLLHLINNKCGIRSWGEKARKRVQQQFSLEKMVTQIEKLYEEIVQA